MRIAYTIADRQRAVETVGMLFQNPDHQIIFPTVEEEVSFGLRQLGKSKSDAQSLTLDALSRFGCEDWAKKSVSTLSQGQRHLVCLIAVVVMQPRLIVLDEPYAGLDIPTVMQLSRYIDSLDAAVVHISHQPDVLTNYERILWIDEGSIRSDGGAEKTLKDYVDAMRTLGMTNAIV